MLCGAAARDDVRCAMCYTTPVWSNDDNQQKEKMCPFSLIGVCCVSVGIVNVVLPFWCNFRLFFLRALTLLRQAEAAKDVPGHGKVREIERRLASRLLGDVSSMCSR